MMASTSTKSKSPTCGAPSAWCFRTLICSPAPSWTTSATAAWTPLMRNASPPRSWQTRTASSAASGRVSDRSHRRRLQLKPGPEAASFHCKGRRGRSPGADSGRGHLLHRHPHRDAGSGGHGPADEGPHHFRDRPPSFHRQKRGLHHGSGTGTDHRARHPTTSFWRKRAGITSFTPESGHKHGASRTALHAHSSGFPARMQGQFHRRSDPDINNPEQHKSHEARNGADQNGVGSRSKAAE